MFNAVTQFNISKTIMYPGLPSFLSKKIAGREATRQENVCRVLTVQVLIFLWN